MVVASPANPTGTMMKADALAQLIAVAEAEGIRVISDEIYHGLDYAFAAETAANVSERAVVINSFSKYFCMTGWRVGWMVVPETLVRTVDRLQGNLAISVPTLSQVAAEAAFDGTAEMEAVKHGYEENRRILIEGLPKAGLDKFLPVDGAFYLYADISRFSDDSLDFAKRMLNEADVAATPGIDFDPIDGRHFLRFCYAGSAAEMHEAVERIGNWLKRLAFRSCPRTNDAPLHPGAVPTPGNCKRRRGLAEQALAARGRTASSELDVQLFHLVRLGLGAGHPFLHRRQRHDRLAIGGAFAVELDVVGEEARHHRREHGVRHAGLCAEQKRAAVGRQAFAPDRHDAVDVGLRAGPDLEAGMMRLQVHRQRRAQVGKAGMHLAADRAAMRARGFSFGSRPASGRVSLRYSRDRQRVPDLDAVMGEAGHQEGGRQQQQFGARRGVVAGDHLLLEVEAGELAQQPAAQRPGAVVLAGDREGSLWG